MSFTKTVRGIFFHSDVGGQSGLNGIQYNAAEWVNNGLPSETPHEINNNDRSAG